MPLSTIIVVGLLCLVIFLFIFFGKIVFQKKTSIVRDGFNLHVVKCYLCAKEVDIETTVDRERQAGIVHYYCNDCIKALFEESRAKLPRA